MSKLIKFYLLLQAKTKWKKISSSWIYHFKANTVFGTLKYKGLWNPQENNVLLLCFFLKITLSIIQRDKPTAILSFFIPLWFGSHQCTYQQDSALQCLLPHLSYSPDICKCYLQDFESWKRKKKIKCLKNKIHNHINTFPGRVKNRVAFIFIKGIQRTHS